MQCRKIRVQHILLIAYAAGLNFNYALTARVVNFYEDFFKLLQQTESSIPNATHILVNLNSK